ncbi:MAG: DUF1418 family protein [Dehalococcoidia bacterium]
MKLLKLLGSIYLALGLTVMLALFIHDCLANDKFLLHFVGIFLVIPAIIYIFWRVSEDAEEYIKQNEHRINSFVRAFESRLKGL